MDKIIIDGSFGEGGGQIVRGSLCLAAALGRALRIEKIRARRPRPGLANQHLAAARAAAKVCGGELAGAKKGALELEFNPGPLAPGRYSFEIGTAGSTTLVLQTVFPLLALSGGESTAMIHGGTHNPMAPPAEFIAESFLPTARLAGFDADIALVRHGFYPKGGGAIRATVRPQQKTPPLDLTAPVDWGRPEATVLITNLPEHVADRERMELADALRIDSGEVIVDALPGEVGPGNAVMVRYRSGGRTALITAFGEPGKRAERVANEAAREAKNFARSGAAIDPRLADQLILLLALGPGGSFTTSEITEHTRTHAEIIRAFTNQKITFETQKPDLHKVIVPGGGRGSQ